MRACVNVQVNLLEWFSIRGIKKAGEEGETRTRSIISDYITAYSSGSRSNNNKHTCMHDCLHMVQFSRLLLFHQNLLFFMPELHSKTAYISYNKMGMHEGKILWWCKSVLRTALCILQIVMVYEVPLSLWIKLWCNINVVELSFLCVKK